MKTYKDYSFKIIKARRKPILIYYLMFVSALIFFWLVVEFLAINNIAKCNVPDECFKLSIMKAEAEANPYRDWFNAGLK